jgi:hypothetical protein
MAMNITPDIVEALEKWVAAANEAVAALNAEVRRADAQPRGEGFAVGSALRDVPQRRSPTKTRRRVWSLPAGLGLTGG